MTERANFSAFNGQINIPADQNMSLKVLEPKLVSDAYVSWMNDYEVVKYTEQRYSSHGISDVEQFVSEKYRSANDILFAIFYNSKHIGNIKLGPINFIHLIGEVSYFIGDKAYWGKGLATLAVDAVTNFAFDEVGLEKVTAGAYSVNVGSVKVLEKCGFELEGTRKSQVLFEGHRIDTLLFGRVKPGLSSL